MSPKDTPAELKARREYSYCGVEARLEIWIPAETLCVFRHAFDVLADMEVKSWLIKLDLCAWRPVSRLHSLNGIRSQGVTGAVERLTGETRSVEAATTLTGW